MLITSLFVVVGRLLAAPFPLPPVRPGISLDWLEVPRFPGPVPFPAVLVEDMDLLLDPLSDGADVVEAEEAPVSARVRALPFLGPLDT